MSISVFTAYRMLVSFEPCLTRGNFGALYQRVRNYPTRSKDFSEGTIDQVCAAVDFACIWYWKQVQCLQRSAATTCLLKRQGIAAQMVIGVQQIPFKAHAWVEVGGRVINDKPYMPEIYAVLDRC
jgi:hypothetical protein